MVQSLGEKLSTKAPMLQFAAMALDGIMANSNATATKHNK
jgi:hypothetical protein